MEDDDEFGDLYTDVLHPLTTQPQPQREERGTAAAAGNASSSQSRPIDLNVNRDDEEILYGAPNLKNSNLNSVLNLSSALGRNLNDPIQEKTLPQSRGFDLNLDSTLGAARVDGLAGDGGDGLGFDARVLEKDEGVKLPQKASGGSNFMEDDDDDINILVEERENKDDDLVVKDDNFINKGDNMYISANQKDNTVGFMNGSVVNEMGSAQMIPGLSGRSENPRGSNFEDDWESEESEDDLRIVLNDNNHVAMRMGMERMPGGIDEDDDDGDQLLIVADNGDMVHHHHQPQMMMEDQEWGGEEGGPGANGEKDLSDTAKPSGGGSAAPAVQPKIAYSNQVYHHPFHSQFKYVRPGAAPLPGGAPAATGGIPGQVRPPVNMAPLAGRGRGEWRPAGVKGALPMQKGFHPGYGISAWGVNAAGRGYGSGLDFTLPSHKTIFEVDIDSFEEKPWKLPGIDVSDFFNFGLNEDSWKDYCKQLEQLRLETTMQSKIRVYESGRAEQDYDPDLPPELAAAVGIQDISSGNANPGKADAGPTDLARASARGRPPVPVGRPIPVETGSGDRTPSIDTRRPRMHDTDAIIEIDCHSSTDNDDMAEHQDKDSARIDLGGGDGNGLQQDDTEHMESFSPAYNGLKREFDPRRSQLKSNLSSDEIVREDGLDSPPEVPVNHRTREIGVPYEERSTKGRGHIRSPMMTTSENKRGKHVIDDQNEKSFDSGDDKRSPTLSSSRAIGSDGEQAVVVEEDMNDGPVMDSRNSDIERGEKDVDTTGDTGEDGNSTYAAKKQKLSSRVKQLSQEDDDGEDSKAARSSDNSKARSGSSKDHRRFPDDVEDEVLQGGRPPRAGHVKQQVDDADKARRKGHYNTDETGRHNIVVRGREDSVSRRGEDANSSLRRHVKSESADWRKESDISEASWHHRRDEDHHGRRTRVEDPRKREHGGEIGSKNRAKVRESEKSENDEHYQSRNQLDSSSWRGANHDHDIMGSRQRDRASSLKIRNEKVDDLHSKRRKEDVHMGREHAEKEDVSHNHRESSGRRKRGRDDGSDQLKRDDLVRLKDDDVHYARQKEGGPFQRERSERQRERDEWYRIKQDEVSSRRDREETRAVMRSGRATDDKAWISHSKGKDDYKGSNREYHPKDVGRHGDQLKRRDRVENESFSQHRGHEDVYARGNILSNDEKKARYERPGSRDGRVTYGSDISRVHEHKRKESSRKSKESESGDHSSLIPSKRNQDEHGGEISETDDAGVKVNLKGRSEHQSGEVHMNRQSSRKHREEASSDDEQSGSKRGRSKLERWTSHKERDFGITTMPSSSLKNKDIDTYNSSGASLVSRPPEETSKKVEDKPQPLVDDKETGAEMNNVNSKVMEDKHLDTVAKLKKRSERFKIPLPSEKDAVAIKKMESEPLPTGTEIRPDSEIKSERPARKRRWTSS